MTTPPLISTTLERLPQILEAGLLGHQGPRERDGARRTSRPPRRSPIAAARIRPARRRSSVRHLETAPAAAARRCQNGRGGPECESRPRIRALRRAARRRRSAATANPKNSRGATPTIAKATPSSAGSGQSPRLRAECAPRIRTESPPRPVRSDAGAVVAGKMSGGDGIDESVENRVDPEPVNNGFPASAMLKRK